MFIPDIRKTFSSFGASALLPDNSQAGSTAGPLKVSLKELLSRIPGEPSEQWPAGERYAVGFEHGTMSLGYYMPVGSDPQQPHQRDEIYIVQSGTSRFILESQTLQLAAGDAVFVPAGAVHRFTDFSADFGAWVVFWGPTGGES